MKKDKADKFHALLTKKISFIDFEKWLYQCKELEFLITKEEYLTLISFNYKDVESSIKSNLYEVEKVCTKYIEFHLYESDYICDILNSIINKDENSVNSIIKIYDLYDDGYDFFRKLGLHYGLCLSGKTNSSQLVYKKMYPNIIDDATNSLNWFKNKKIIFTSIRQKSHLFEYVDLRNDAEKSQGAYY